MKEPSLKSTYRVHLGAFALFNFAIFWAVIVNGVDADSISGLLSALSLTDGLLGVFAPVIAVVLNGLLTAKMKARLVYWKIANPLPGSEAFSRYLYDDDRIDIKALRAKLEDIPIDPGRQNQIWYKLYSENKNDVRIQDAHRNWLLTRDLTGFGALFLIVFGATSTFVTAPLKGWYLFYLLAQYLAAMTPSNTYGKRFVTTVLTVESHKND